MEITSVQPNELQIQYITENQWFPNFKANYHVWSNQNFQLPANHYNIPSIFNNEVTTNSTNTHDGILWFD